MTLHFSAHELAARRSRTREELARRDLDGLLVFRQESMYYLTGYDTFGFVFFQCLVMGTGDDDVTLLTRPPDLRQARHTSMIEDIRVWHDAPDADPAAELRSILEERGLSGRRLGIETDAYGLTGFNLRRVEVALRGTVELIEASDIVTRLRAVKSEAEIVYVRTAARLADDALDAALEAAGPGVFEGDVLAALQGAIFSGGGDFPANEVIVGSGPRALLFRYAAGMRHLDEIDQLSLEWAGAFRHYHAAMMRTLCIGRPSTEHHRMFPVVEAAMVAMTEALAPGRPVGEVDDAHRRVLDSAGFGSHRYAACGYSLGCTFAPNWMDWPMLYSGNEVEAAPGMTFFLHAVIVDSDSGTAMSLGRTCLVTQGGREVLSRHPLELLTV